MASFWNERFDVDEYVYGTEPNQYYKKELGKLTPGKILFPAEGEGRNAVYAAEQGWEVTAFDPSTVAKEKALNLARQNNVSIHYQISNYDEIEFPEASFDCIVLIFAHMHPLKRTEYHKKLLSFLKPGGQLILEGFSKKQINNKTGGPPNVELLFSEDELRKDFNSLSPLKITETDVVLDEGPFHQGRASVIRVTGKK